MKYQFNPSKRYQDDSTPAYLLYTDTRYTFNPSKRDNYDVQKKYVSNKWKEIK